MKDYKLKSLIHCIMLTFGSGHILTSSQVNIQAKLNEYAQSSWWLMSTNTTNFEAAVCFYPYFERD